MRPILTTSLMAILAAISISACSSASSSANAADNSAAAADNSAAAANNGAAAADNSAAAADNSAAAPADNSAAAPAAGAIPVYPGAAAAALPAAAGTPPPGGKSWATTDSFDKVKAWYTANLKGGVLKGSTATDAMYLIGDEKTGTVVMVHSDKGKVWILSGPANDVK